MNLDIDIKVDVFQSQVHTLELLDHPSVRHCLQLFLLVVSLGGFFLLTALPNLVFDQLGSHVVDDTEQAPFNDHVDGRVELDHAGRVFLIRRQIFEPEHRLELRDQLGDRLQHLWACLYDQVGHFDSNLQSLLHNWLVEDVEGKDQGEGIASQVVVSNRQQVTSLCDFDAFIIYKYFTSPRQPRVVHDLRLLHLLLLGHLRDSSELSRHAFWSALEGRPTVKHVVDGSSATSHTTLSPWRVLASHCIHILGISVVQQTFLVEIVDISASS